MSDPVGRDGPGAAAGGPSRRRPVLVVPAPAGPAAGGMRVVVDAASNSLRLLVPRAGGAPGPTADGATVARHHATLDVGEGGRLLGLEVTVAGADTGDWYLELEGAPGDQLRSVEVTVDVARDASGEPLWVDLPRRGPGYELSFPVGNACWVRPRWRPG